MPAHKLVLDEVFEQPYKLIAIHASIEEYRIAFLLNKHLNLKLARLPKDLDLHLGADNMHFAHYLYEDEQNYCTYHMVSNLSMSTAGTGKEEHSLFLDDNLVTKTSYLLPEFKQVDFLIKIEDEMEIVSEKLLVQQILEIPQVTTAYAIDFDRVKTKKNLIFD